MSEAACETCFHRCRLKDGAVGLCRARKNEGGKVICSNYGKVTSMALDPIEKKPLARFFPGSMILSVGSFGCDLDCPFCQNDSISCVGEDGARWEYVSPEKLCDTAVSLVYRGNIGVAYTYNEPMVGWEYVRDTARLVRKKGLKNVVVTNGSVSLDALGEVLPFIDAFNIDLKGFTPEWYKKLGGDLDTVLAFIKAAAKTSHVELTTLVVPGENDSEADMRRLAEWVASVDPGIPLHITRFFPRRKMKDLPPTDPGSMAKLQAVAREHLSDVLLGNV